MPSSPESSTAGFQTRFRKLLSLIAAYALTTEDARWALPDLIDMLDDRFLLNRQFTQRGLERMLNIKLVDFGYRFYMTPEERRQPLGRLRTMFLTGTDRTSDQVIPPK